MSKPDMKAITKEIIQRLDIQAECERLGVNFTSNKPGSGGWLSCHAVDRDDKNSSAGINVNSGWYNDHGKDNDKGCSFFDLTVMLGNFTDWKDAQRHYAEQVGVKLPTLKSKKSRFDWQNIVATYDYCDEQGTVLYRAVRDKNKEFSQQTFVNDEFINTGPKTNGVKFVPYNNQKLTKSVDTVHIAEGEKDCDRLEQNGFTATCNIGGAGKWKSQKLSTYLEGRDVVILPDNDEAGEKHALQVASDLHNIAASIKIPCLPGLPKKGDVSDWFDAGGTVEELQRLISECKEWEPPAESEQPVEGICESLDDPTRIARLFVEENPHLKFWSGDFHDFHSVCYTRIEDETIRAKLHLFTESQFRKDLEFELKVGTDDDKPPKKRKVTVNLIHNILAAIKARTLLPKETKMPSWLVKSEWQANRCIVAQNGIVPIDSPETIIVTVHGLVHGGCGNWSGLEVGVSVSIRA